MVLWRFESAIESRRGNHLEASAWIEHIPFAFWLIEAHQPRVMVELGTHHGTSYFAFCQAVERLGLDTRCIAVDTWKEDEHSGSYGENVFEAVRRHNDAQYSSAAGRALTDRADATTHVNFFEFSEPRFVDTLQWWTDIRPWEIRIDGLVARPFSIDIDDLLAKMRLEERIYRFRCVEAWAITVPWTGFPLRDLVALADPLGSAKYVRFETFYIKRWAPRRVTVVPASMNRLS